MFNIGDKVYNKEQPNEIYQVIEVDAVTGYIPNYTLASEEGYTFESFCLGDWRKVVTPDDALRYGEVLTDDNLYCELQAEDGFKGYHYVRIRTIRYESRIFYHKMVNGEVVEFKELTT